IERKGSAKTRDRAVKLSPSSVWIDGRTAPTDSRSPHIANPTLHASASARRASRAGRFDSRGSGTFIASPSRKPRKAGRLMKSMEDGSRRAPRLLGRELRLVRLFGRVSADLP